MNDIDQIKIILEKIRTNDDMINIPSKDEWTKMINQDGYDIETAISNSERILKESMLNTLMIKLSLKIVCMNMLLRLFL